MKRLILAAMFSALPPAAASEEDIEMPAYSVLVENGAGQVRAYAPMIVAEVEVEASSLAAAANEGFRPLASYIFGGNSPRQKIAMTSPVMAAPAGQRIAMTSPVTALPAAVGEGYVVRFIMPDGWTMDSLPHPDNPAVRLAEIPARTLAAWRYRGPDSAGARRQAETALTAFIAEAGFAPAGPVEWAGYDSPMVPFFLRRYEIMVPVEPANKK